tara:strand:- start:288 stop:611 length:324 start_codon:yes stop_codon:yes gene_type:complete
MMTESEFNFVVDDALLAIEDALDEAESDLDSENSGGVLTLTCESGSKLIFTRQTPVRQLWIATPAGGFHFDYVEKQWLRDSDQLGLAQFLGNALSELTDEKLCFNRL